MNSSLSRPFPWRQILRVVLIAAALSTAAWIYIGTRPDPELERLYQNQPKPGASAHEVRTTVEALDLVLKVNSGARWTSRIGTLMPIHFLPSGWKPTCNHDAGCSYFAAAKKHRCKIAVLCWHDYRIAWSVKDERVEDFLMERTTIILPK